jgi:hypothetical protein
MNLTIDGIYLHNMAGYGAVHYFGGDHYGLIVDGKYANNHAVTYGDRKEGKTGWALVFEEFDEFYYHYPQVFWGVTAGVLTTIIVIGAISIYNIVSAASAADAILSTAPQVAKVTDSIEYQRAAEASDVLRPVRKIMNTNYADNFDYLFGEVLTTGKLPINQDRTIIHFFREADGTWNSYVEFTKTGRMGFLDKGEKWGFEILDALKGQDAFTVRADQLYPYAKNVYEFTQYKKSIMTVWDATKATTHLVNAHKFNSIFSKIKYTATIGIAMESAIGIAIGGVVVSQLLKSYTADDHISDYNDYIVSLLDNQDLYNYDQKTSLDEVNTAKLIYGITDAALQMILPEFNPLGKLLDKWDNETMEHEKKNY